MIQIKLLEIYLVDVTERNIEINKHFKLLLKITKKINFFLLLNL
jgi:hypothetical protein